MDKQHFTIKQGLYLVIDPSMPLPILVEKVAAALQGGVDIIQIWNYFKEGVDKAEIIGSIVNLAHKNNVPVLINEDTSLLSLVDGIHFDEIPPDFSRFKQSLGKHKIIGITCGNNFSKIEWAVENELDYISFCSVFPSKSVNTCDLVSRDIIQKTRAFTQMPIFLSGGIDLNNLPLLKDTGLDGIAVISGIMGTENPALSASAYKHALAQLNHI
ncbi:thiamine phosphate synthase [Parasediminibacterium sp. JCM 36343]|uniref:thiamine phosphate synthase n=1 Tax=Parasediminibacterium sp. JCM 36343 TaxID=3374279 RepID=UPI003979BCD0